MSEHEKFGPEYYAGHADELGWGAGHQADAFKVALLAAEVRGDSVLDVASGPGVYAAALAKDSRRVVCADGSRQLLRAARERHGIRLAACADALRLPFRPRSFDTVLLLSVLEHVDDAALMREAARVARRRIVLQVPMTEPVLLREAGLLFSHWLDRSHLRTYSEDDVRRLVTGAGWRLVRFEPAYRRDLTTLYRAALSTEGMPGVFRRVIHRALEKLRPRVPGPPAECFAVAEPE